MLSHSRGQGMVAFKRLDRHYGQGDLEFWKEIMILSRYTHDNIISLLGFCDEDGEKILVYEHASHGSLDHHLGTATLTWKQRLKICLAAAKGLRYLHDPKETQHRVLHRDIKSSNILLDENWNAKVSDMGMSKIGPANQHHTLLVSNATGTPGYVDPLYVEKSILTKESDIYSFGVVLFEALCGRLCYEYNNLHFQSLVPKWKKSYKEKKIHDIIFQCIKKHMDQRSLEIFSNIAYRCLKNSRKRRPKIHQVVENLEKALWWQEISEDIEQPICYEEMSRTMLPPLFYRSKEEFKMLLFNGILVNDGKTWISLNKKGEHCEMISAAECLFPIVSASPMYKYDGPQKSRFVVNDQTQFLWEFKTHVRTQFLSPHVTYRVNLVFDFNHTSMEYLGFNYILRGDTKSSTSYVVNKREDGWLMAELYEFTCEERNVDLEITFDCQCPLVFEGIEFQPLETVEHEPVEDDIADTISHSDTYWEQKLPSNYEDIIKLSTDSLQCTTKKELYFIFCKGFLINDGKEWFSLAKNGKKRHMLSTRVAFDKAEWSWLSIPQSRFKEAAFHPHRSFWIYCRSKILSPQTTYAAYLIYKLQKNPTEPLVKVKSGVFLGSHFNYEKNHSWYIYLLSPQTPIIRGKFYENTHNPWNRAKMKGLPHQRNDGWMEVQLWEFRTGTRDPQIWANLRLTLHGNMPHKGLIVQGIMFKPK